MLLLLVAVDERGGGVEPLQFGLVGDRIYMSVEQDADAPPDHAGKQARDAANPDVVAWETLMGSFQKSLPFAPDRKWVEMERIYSLDEQR